MATYASRATLHALVDSLPESDVGEAERLLESFIGADPALRAALLAPVDDEPLTEDEIASIEQGRAEIERGEYVTDEELDALLSQQQGE